MSNKLSPEEKDLRIEKASAVKEAISKAGFKIIQEEWEKIKEGAFVDLRNEQLAPEELRAAQIVYNQICEWINIPDNIIKEAQEIAKEQERPQRFLNKKIPFLDRSY